MVDCLKYKSCKLNGSVLKIIWFAGHDSGFPGGLLEAGGPGGHGHGHGHGHQNHQFAEQGAGQDHLSGFPGIIFFTI